MRGPREIADELERAPVTVRGQLYRGLAILRGVVPAAIALGVAPRLPATSGTVEQLSRRTLDRAIEAGLVRPQPELPPGVPARSSAHVGVAGAAASPASRCWYGRCGRLPRRPRAWVTRRPSPGGRAGTR